jgi:protein-S-isoprenylcysteine O-methyltransferase Ste14
LFLMTAGHLLGSWALISNPFFSGVVRLQKERHHQVVRSGPYRWVRHPGYAGALLAYGAAPLLLDSVWIFFPVLFLTLVLAVRIQREEKFLKENLEGYSAYTEKTRYRLIPGIW